jgi:hypothetical protein
VLGVERRSGPLWVAAAGSLKIFPLLFALVYIGRRQWWRLLAAVVLTAVLWAPALLFDLSEYAVQAGQAAALYQFPVAYFLVVGLAISVTLALSATRWGWGAAATTVVLSLPRLFVYDVTYLMVGTTAGQRPAGATRRKD